MIEKTILRLLSLKNYSTYELKKKLLNKGFTPEEIEPALKKFAAYLNDSELAERRLEEYKKRGYGPRKIAAKLLTQGLAPRSISPNEQKASIKKILTTPSFERKDRMKKMGALQRRGFDLEVIIEVFR